jgi:hypothetical protein
MDAIKKFWSETMEIPEARWIVILSGLVIFVAVSYYVVKLFRDMATGKSSEPSDYISEFQKFRDEGKLDEEEFSRLAKSIPKVIPEHIKDNPFDEVPDFEEQPEPTD